MSTVTDQITDLACDLAEEFALGMPEDRFEDVDGTPANALVKATSGEIVDLLKKAIRAGSAAELRRLADAADGVMAAGVHVGFQMLRNRAEELDGDA